MNAVIVYYSGAEKTKQANEDRVANEFEKILSKNYSLKKIVLKTKSPLNLKQQFKQEKNLELKESPKSLAGVDLLVIGTPIVGSLTSAPTVNSFIRTIQKSKNNEKIKVILFSTGIIHGLEMKKMSSLLSMKGIKAAQSVSFTSMFEFDAKKINEINQSITRMIEKTLEK